MEVTASNFEALFPDIVDAINRCDFAAIDCEFTGLDLAGRRREEYFDDLEQRYGRVRTSAQHFLVIQVGLSLFEWDPVDRKYKASTYNCYVYPRPHGPMDLRFTCQASSLEFLSKHNFDFNKFIYQGIPFLSLGAADELYAKLEQRSAAPTPQQTAPGPAAAAPPARDIRQALKTDEDKQRHSNIIERVRKWLAAGRSADYLSTETEEIWGGGKEDGAEASPEGPVRASVGGVQVADESTQKERREGGRASARDGPGEEDPDVLTFEPMNSFWRAVVYQTMEREFGKEHFLIEKVPSFSGNLDSLRLVCSNKDAVLEAERARLAEKRARIEQAVGFSRVFRALSAAKKPVVGHNMLLDLAYIFHLFVQPLPPSFEEFRELVGSFFPSGIYDTKHLAVQIPEAFPPFAGTALDAVFQAFRSRVAAPAQASDQAATTNTGRETGGAPMQVAQLLAEIVKSHAEKADEPVGIVAGEAVVDHGSELQAPGGGPAPLVAGVTSSALLASEGHVPSPGGTPPVAAAAVSPIAQLGSSPSFREFLIGAKQSPFGPAAQAERLLAAPREPAEAMPLVEHADRFGRYLETEGGPAEFGHEAGFDAFMTGVAFVGLSKVMEVRKDRPELAARRLFRRSWGRMGASSGRPILGQHAGGQRSGAVQGGQMSSPFVVKRVSVSAGLVDTERKVVDAEVVATQSDIVPQEDGSQIGGGGIADGILSVTALEATRPIGQVAPAAAPPAGGLACSAAGNGLLESGTLLSARDEEEAGPTVEQEAQAEAQRNQETEVRELRELLDRTSSSPIGMEGLRQYAYRINLMWSDMPHIPLQGPLTIPERAHVFHLSGISEETRSPDIAGRFADLGLGYVDITWIDRSSAFIALRSRTLSDTVIDNVDESGWNVDIMRWSEHCLQGQSLLQGKAKQRQEGKETNAIEVLKDVEGQARKGRKLNDGLRKKSALEEEDAERNKRRVQKSLLRQTCTIL